MDLRDWSVLLRVKTLGAAVSPVLVAWSLGSLHDGSPSLWLLALVIFSAACIQILTNLVNDRVDFLRGVDGDERAGPRRALQSGVISLRQLDRLIMVVCLLAVISGLMIVFHAGLLVLFVGLLSLLCAFLYTAGPVSIAATGAGELFAFIFFGVIACGISYFVFTGELQAQAFVYGALVGMFAVVLIGINNLRDYDQDEQSGRKTLVIRWGLKRYRQFLIAATLLPFVAVMMLIFEGVSMLSAFLPLLVLPLALKVVFRLRVAVPGDRSLNGLLAMTGLLQLSFSVVLSAGLLVEILP